MSLAAQRLERIMGHTRRTITNPRKRVKTPAGHSSRDAQFWAEYEGRERFREYDETRALLGIDVDDGIVETLCDRVE